MHESSGYCGSGGGIESVGCGEDREYGNDRRWRGMKSVWRKTVSRFLADRLGIMGLVVGRERERIDYFRGLLRETDKKELSFRGIESKIVRRHPR